MIKALPDQHKFESEIRDLYDEGDIAHVAMQLHVDRTTVSRALNPGETAHRNMFFTTAKHLWALDSIGKSNIAEDIFAILKRWRAWWLPANRVMTEPAKASSKIVREVAEFLEKELEGAPDEVLFKEADDILRAVEAKLDEIRFRREARMLGIETQTV